MGSLRSILFSSANRLAHALPKGLQRRIADFPGMLRLMEKLSSRQLELIATPEGTRLAINPLFHSYLSRAGLADHEPAIRGAILRLTRPGMVAYDIGANVGVFSFLFASLVGEEGLVYAFEPEKNNYNCFKKSLEINKTKNIVLDTRAVGQAKSSEKFDRRGGAFSGRLVGDAHYEATDNVEIVETVSVDHLIAHEGYQTPDILKIDVEGNERLVLEGMAHLLQSSSPIILCELHTHLGEPSERVIELLQGYGYKITNVQGALTGNAAATTDVTKELHIIATK